MKTFIVFSALSVVFVLAACTPSAQQTPTTTPQALANRTTTAIPPKQEATVSASSDTDIQELDNLARDLKETDYDEKDLDDIK